MIIRAENTSDHEAITMVSKAAFATLTISNQTEHYIIKALREAGALTISLVAEIDERVVGHIAFSPIKISDGSNGWHGLGPVSVLPEMQRQGIGAALINQGLSLLREMGSSGCVLVGHPGYYPRFGFTNPTELTLEGVPAEALFILSFMEKIPQGTVQFHKAFAADA